MNDWITTDQHTEASIEALTLADEFMFNKQMHGEEIWEEIWVDGKAFDVNIWEESFDPESDSRTSPVHVSLYPTVDNGRGYRQTDGERSILLHTITGGV